MISQTDSDYNSIFVMEAANNKEFDNSPVFTTLEDLI